MPKKIIVAILAAATALIAAVPRPALAQSGPEVKPIRFFLDFGYVNLFDRPKWLALGPDLEFRLGRSFSINPEVTVWLSQNFRGKAKIVPGATANVHIKRFSFGAGAVRRVSDWAEEAGGGIVPKVQVGYLVGATRLTLSCLYLSTTDDLVIGLTFGMALGRPPRG
ncbi:MAG: hypothetical protein JW775_11010 [Candidatus Aminicenantes bacterium]|nr:hypothetical protein [Candidatus Aminicenantes bacterium]